MNQLYLNTLESYRLTHPSNLKAAQMIETIEGEIISFEYDDFSFSFKTIEGKLYLITDVPENTFNRLLIESYRGELTLDKGIYQYSSSKNTSSFDYDRYLFSLNYKGKYPFIQYKPQNKVSIHNLFLKLKSNLFIKLQAMPNTYSKTMVQALFYKDYRNFEQVDLYKDLGIFHLFAISGLHFGIIYVFASKFTFMGNFIIRKIVSAFFLIVAYALIGGGVSALRAVLMVIYIIIANILKKPLDLISMICTVNLIILIFKPFYILNSGYLLSFYAYISVAFILPKILKSFPKSSLWQNKIVKAIISALILQIILLPVTSYVFKNVNLFSFISNLVYIPVFSMLMPYFISFWFIGNNLIEIDLFKLWDQLLARIIGISEIMPLVLTHKIPFDSFDILTIIAVIMFYTALKASYKFRSNFKVFYISILIMISFLIANNIFRLNRDKLVIEVIDVGHGDSTLITYHGQNILIDTGASYAHIEDILVSKGIYKLDYVIITHAHDDHMGALAALINAIEIQHFMVADNVTTKFLKSLENDPTFKISSEVYLRKVEEVEYSKITIDDLCLDVYNINDIFSPDDEDPNDVALLTLLNWNDFNAVFTGDISAEYIEKLNIFNDDIDLLKIPHHGSLTGQFKFFLENHAVKNVYISNSRKYLMPNQAVLDHLEKLYVNTLSTFSNGNIKWIIDRDKIYWIDYFGNKGNLNYDE